jgi:hypothetical protein
MTPFTLLTLLEIENGDYHTNQGRRYMQQKHRHSIMSLEFDYLLRNNLIEPIKDEFKLTQLGREVLAAAYKGAEEAVLKGV